MKTRYLTLLTMLMAGTYAYGQSPNIEKENWADKPVLSAMSDANAKESAVVVLDKRRVEYMDAPKDEMVEYYTLHKVIHINDDRGIESFNKIYLGVNENSDIIDVKARTILPGGKIIELDKSNIKDVKEEDGNVYKIFALDGLVKGCEIEYYYTFKRSFSFFGREVVQGGIPVLKTTFQLIRPQRLRFEIRPYNCTVTPIDTLLGTKRFMQCTFENTPGVDDEKYAFYDANLKRLEYKLSYNEANQKSERLFTWNELAKRAFSIYAYSTDKDTKKIQDLIKANGWDRLTDETKKIIAVENYVKKAYGYNEDLKSDEGNELDNVLQKKITGTIGAARLYNAIFKNLGVNFQFVLSGDRNKFVIDKDFENWNNCDNPLIYFPAENKFIAPTRPDYRYPMILPSWGETNGLFCKGTSIGNFTTAIAEVRNVALEDYHGSYQNLESKLELTKDLDSLNIDAKQLFAGYPAVTYRDAFNFSNDQQKKDIIKEMAKQVSSTDHILFSEALNKEFDDTEHPFILHTKTRSSDLVERAGSKLLLKIGMAIGPQVEMYQEKARQQPVNMDFAHIEKRTLEFVVPPGYKISNLNDLKISQTYTDNGDMTMGFVSDYEMNGNVLKVNIMEEYRKTFYPTTQFDQFRKIINSSADFNKVVLVLEKV